MILTLQDKKAELSEGLLEVVERATELETLLKDNLLRQQQELNQTLGSADVEADRCPCLPTSSRFSSSSQENRILYV